MLNHEKYSVSRIDTFASDTKREIYSSNAREINCLLAITKGNMRSQLLVYILLAASSTMSTTRTGNAESTPFIAVALSVLVTSSADMSKRIP